MAHLLVKSRIETAKARVFGMFAHNANKPSPIYGNTSYLDIIRERQRLGSNGYVDLNDMMRVCGRVTVVTPNEDDSQD